MNFVLGFIFLFAGFFNSDPLEVTLSDQAEIGLLTCAPGDQLYSTFGHSAIHINDPANGLDVVYNYGMFSFNTDNFYYKFVKGETDYELGKESFVRFLREYNWYGRNVYEHSLDLTIGEKQALYIALETNYLPENRVYRYSYMLDNCSSRIRDMLSVVLKDKLSWQGETAANVIPDAYPFYDILEGYHSQKFSMTYRDILDMYLLPGPWADFGIDLCIGAPADKSADLHGSMFIPDFLMNAVCHAQVERNGVTKPLVKSVQLQTAFYESSYTSVPSSIYDPEFILWFICFIVLGITIFEFFKKKSYRVIDSIIFSILGIFAIVVWFVSFVSVHPAVFPNYSVIWLLPTHLLLAIVIYIPVLRKATVYYHNAVFIITLLFLLCWPFIPQCMNLTNIPVMLLPFFRSLKYSLEARKITV